MAYHGLSHGLIRLSHGLSHGKPWDDHHLRVSYWAEGNNRLFAGQGSSPVFLFHSFFCTDPMLDDHATYIDRSGTKQLLTKHATDLFPPCTHPRKEARAQTVH